MARFGYNLRTASEYELEVAEYLWEAGLAFREDKSGPNGEERMIHHREATPEHHDEFDRLYHRGAHR